MSAENALEKRDKLLMDSFNRIENKMRLVGATGEKSMNWLLQGVFFSGPPLNSLSTKSLYKLWHLEKFWSSLYGILYLENSGGSRKKQNMNKKKFT